MSSSAIKPLEKPALHDALAKLPLWTHDADRQALYRKIVFTDFAEALAAMVRIGFAAEQADHHPEWANVYNRLEIWLTTHDAGGVSTRDIKLAQQIDATIGES
ncbi:4a-hydroxytetrahydrobiopterin dehydratase [Croceicoccus sp. F390]|uniref:Putative pterin-4-alpha-carbinolamine dehydratase n=1 Tax=Croceicoccus esteveae TaxID=3075597 RepID=A0ABU2ZH74_9SPHN|nr:4a-hydroxytetrahydrobiopterin dehydratase [Croceicoccus sp. F390]MDT0575945.1 4a-hydroxytetrahydrobiopterin dehydratase [Croceicoccus sp. F390]